MNVRTRIWLLPALAAAIFAVGIAVVLTFSERSSSSIDEVGTVDYPFVDATTQLANQLEDLAGTIQSAVAEGDKKRLDDANEHAASLRKLLDKIAAIDGKAESGKRLRERFETYFAASVDTAQIFLGIKQGDQGAAVQHMQSEQKTLDNEVKAVRRAAADAFAAGLSSAHAGVRGSVTAILVTAGLVVAGLGLASYLVIGSVWRELGGEPEYARDVMRRMAQGDLSQQIEVPPGAGESLLGAVRDMSQGLASIVGNVRSGADAMSQATREIALGNQDLSERTEQQAASLEATSGNMQTLTQAVTQSADSAAQADQLAGSAATVARKGGDLVSAVVTTMGEINTSSKKIADIIGIIDSIAFQTNILALNAAVEAARAGEHGRGFAVVAGEVRSLAQRSAGAAREIKALIQASVQRVESGLQLVENTGATMGEIVDRVQRVTDMIGEISSASREQSQSIGGVNQSVSELDRMTQQNAALVEQAAAAAASLRGQADELVNAVSSFRLG